MIEKDEIDSRLALSSYKTPPNPIIPESTRIKSQFKVMRGNINRSKTFKGNKFVHSDVKFIMHPRIKQKYLNSLQGNIEIQAKDKELNIDTQRNNFKQ